MKTSLSSVECQVSRGDARQGRFKKGARTPSSASSMRPYEKLADEGVRAPFFAFLESALDARGSSRITSRAPRIPHSALRPPHSQDAIALFIVMIAIFV